MSSIIIRQSKEWPCSIIGEGPANEECPDAGRSKIRGIVAEDAQFGSANAFQRHWSYKKCSDTDRGRNDERYM